MKKIDRIDRRGNIREHILVEGSEQRTLCGLYVEMSQEPCGNAACFRCAQVAAMQKSDKNVGQV